MTSRGTGLPKGKISTLIALGLGEADVHRFLKEKHAALTLAGVKNASNVPQDINKRVAFLERLFDRQEHLNVLLNWVSTLDDLGEMTDPTKAIEEIATLDAEFSQRTRYHSPLAIYSHWLVEGPKLKWHLGVSKTSPKKDNAQAPADKSKPRLKELDEALRIVKGETIAEPTDPVFTTFIVAITELAKGNRDATERALLKLGSESRPNGKAYAELVSTLIGSRFHSSPCPNGLEVRQAKAELPTGIEGQEHYQALGRMTNPLGPGHRFFEIFAILHERNLYKIGKAEASRLFPNRGSAIAFAAKMTGQSIPQGSEWALTIKMNDGASDQASCRFSVESIDHRLHGVLTIPHKSSEPNSIRNWISSANPGAGNIPVFELADGYLLPVTHFPPNFDEPLGYLNSLVSYEVDGRRLVVDQFGAPDGFLDCSPPAITIRRLFKARSEMVDIPKLTKTQVQKLADLAARESESGGIRSGIERAKGDVENLLAMEEELSFVVHEFLKDKNVLESLDAEKQRILAEFEKDLEGRRKEIDDLLLQEKRVVAEIKQLRAKQTALTDGLGEHLKAAFKIAADDGLGVLSTVAVLSPFLQPEQASPKQDTLNTIKAVGSPARSAKEIIGGILGLGWRYGLPQGTLCQAIAFSKANGLVGFHGKATPLFQEAISLTLAGNLSATVSLSVDMFGWGDILDAPVATSRDDLPAMSLGEFIALAQRSAVPAHVSIVGANRLPPESYFPELLAIAGFGGLGKTISWRGFDGRFYTAKLVSPIFFSFTFAYGKSTFQISNPLSNSPASRQLRR